jgi:nucleoside-diphosphate-sugar epimerase
MVQPLNTVLVTGATGFIGRHALAPLVARGFHVHAVSSKRAQPRISDVVWHAADLLDADAARALVETIRPTHLLHFAWSVVPGGGADPEDNFRWVQATLELVRQFAAIGGRRAVVTGSCAEYDWRQGYCVEQLTPVAPRTSYGVCKNATRLVCERYFAELGLSFAWARIFFVYGPHEPLPRFVPSIVTSLNKRTIAQCTHGDQVRDYLHVEDAAEACVAVLDTDVQGPINIASGQPVRLRDMAGYIARRFKSENLLRMGALRPPMDDPPLLVGDVRRLTTDVGWRPRHNMQTGLDHTIAWWMNKLSDVPEVECLS